MIRLKFPLKIDEGVRKEVWVELAPSMNIQVREHFQAKRKRKAVISRLIRLQMGGENFTHEVVTKKNKKTGKVTEKDVYTWNQSPLKNVRIVYRRASVKLLDPIDNFGASFKNLGDVIVELGIISDDASDCIDDFKPDPHRVPHIKDAYIEIEIHETQ